jgi:hypothetical protein
MMKGVATRNVTDMTRIKSFTMSSPKTIRINKAYPTGIAMMIAAFFTF